MRILLLFGVLLLAACSTLSREVRLDPAVDFAELHSFALRQPADGSAEPGLVAARREIERAIGDALTEKGYRRVAVGQADFEVDYQTYVSERFQAGAHDRYLFEGRVRLLSGAESQLDDPIREGTLHIHLWRKGKPFYEAIASDVVDKPKPVDKRIRAAVFEMLEDVPDTRVKP